MPAPSIPSGTWTRVDNGGGPYNPYFYRSVVLGNGDIWEAWGTPDQDPQRGNFVFHAATATWARTNDVAHDPTRNVGARENYGAWFDADRDRVWIGDGAPVSYGFPDGPQSGDMAYDVAADTFSLVFPNYGANKSQTGKGDGAFVYYKDALYSFGGWSVGPQQALTRHDLVVGQITDVGTSSTPTWSTDPARMTFTRSGVDDNGVLWTLADDGELYQLDTTQATPAWTHVVTTGDAPAGHFVTAGLHQARNEIVCYVGYDGIAQGGVAAEVGDTFILDLGSKAWRYGPRLQNGDTVPTRVLLAGQVMNYDATNQRMVLTVAHGYGTEVWAFVPGNP
jgi:hypothetical protein